MWSIFLGIFLVINFASELCADDADDLLVVTRLGKIRGSYQRTNLGRRYRGFEGIPYAQPPVGKLRFEVFELFLLFNYCFRMEVFVIVRC